MHTRTLSAVHARISIAPSIGVHALVATATARAIDIHNRKRMAPMPVLEVIERTTLKGSHNAIEAELARLLTCTPADPFNIDNACPFNATGHDPIATCRDIVCCHCAKVFWK